MYTKKRKNNKEVRSTRNNSIFHSLILFFSVMFLNIIVFLSIPPIKGKYCR